MPLSEMLEAALDCHNGESKFKKGKGASRHEAIRHYRVSEELWLCISLISLSPEKTFDFIVAMVAAGPRSSLQVHEMRDDMLLLRPVGCGTGGQLCNDLHRVASQLGVCKTIRENEYMAVTWHTGWELFLFDQFR